MNDFWNQLAARTSFTLSTDQHQKLSQYLDLLLQANQRRNLTRITDPAAAEMQHVGDALTLLPFLPRVPHRLADVGSGGGVPGIPLAIARPDATIFLIESTRKKADFLCDTAAALALNNVTIIPDRAEAAARTNLRDSCDVAVARAVGQLALLVEWCLPLVKKGGKMLAMKGARIADELPAAKRAIHALAGGEPTIHPVDLPGKEHHVIVQIPKTGKTDPRYPRDPTLAKGKPIA
jgi:16S rRNA (guanine527-N7)-methyltransferase